MRKRIRVSVMGVTICFLLAIVWTVLAVPDTALAKKPGGGGGKGGTTMRNYLRRSINLLGLLLILVGHANMGDGWVGGEAFIWDAETGMQNLQEVLTRDYGLGPSLDGWTLQHAEAISADGRVIVGYGTNPSGQTEAFRAVVPEPSTLVGLLSVGAVGLLACVRRRRRR